MEDIEATIKKMEVAYSELTVKVDEVRTVLFTRQLELIAALKNEVISAAKELKREKLFNEEKTEQQILEHENLITTYAQLLHSWKNVQETLPRLRKLAISN